MKSRSILRNGLKELRLVETTGTENKFTDGEITIVTGRWSYFNGLHHIFDPANAWATFISLGKRHKIKNAGRIATVEDWYKDELLPKFRALDIKNRLRPATVARDAVQGACRNTTDT